ncbi:MAG: ribonuclease P protein component [Planctomycetes bacterium]|nr:ribonuclease P protein component [Planctomycetota bacterium]
MPRVLRVVRASDFRRIYARGRRAHGRHLTVVAARRREPGHRLGLAVSKEHGHAVRRNKIKRILREAFRLERPTLPGAFDLVLIPKPFEGRLQLAAVRSELARLVGQLDGEPEPRTRDGRSRPRGGRRRRGNDGAPRA